MTGLKVEKHNKLQWLTESSLRFTFLGYRLKSLAATVLVTATNLH